MSDDMAHFNDPDDAMNDPNHQLTVHGYIMGLRRVEGDDGDADQILRWAIEDKSKDRWDVFRIHKKGEYARYVSRKRASEEGDFPVDLMVDWKDSFTKCA